MGHAEDIHPEDIPHERLAAAIRPFILSGMLGGEEGGVITMNGSVLADEAADCAAYFVEECLLDLVVEGAIARYVREKTRAAS